jgi:hypothetical protein
VLLVHPEIGPKQELKTKKQNKKKQKMGKKRLINYLINENKHKKRERRWGV